MQIEEELERIEDTRKALESIKSISGSWRAFMVLLKKDMKAVLEYYLDNIAISRQFGLKGRPIITSILMMDLEKGWGRTITKSMTQQIDELKNLANEHPILPYLAIDPRRADDGKDNLYDLFLKAFTEGDVKFFGVKIYPSLGYSPSDERLLPIYEICEKKNIPVLTHCGGEIVSTFEKEIEVRIGSKREIWAENNRIDLARRLNNPENWEYVLERYKNLKLNVAHFGGDTAWQEYRDNGSQKRIDKIVELMNVYENVYADFSFNVIEEGIFDTFDVFLSNSIKAKERSLFGTDFWVVLPAGSLVERQEDFLITLEDHRDDLISINPRKYLFGMNTILTLTTA
jgi:predicted TIM-barrel fold metal-dependent hydrolase